MGTQQSWNTRAGAVIVLLLAVLPLPGCLTRVGRTAAVSAGSSGALTARAPVGRFSGVAAVLLRGPGVPAGTRATLYAPHGQVVRVEAHGPSRYLLSQRDAPVAYAEVHQQQGVVCYYAYRTQRLMGYSQAVHALRIDQYVLQNGHAVFVGYDTILSDRVLHFHRSGAWIGETSIDRKTPPVASSGIAPLRIGAVGSGVGTVHTQEKVPSSAQIRAAQERLDGLGFAPGDIDGILGPRTSAALRKYQGASGLPITGRFNAATLRAMGLETRMQ